ncbi:MAG TPA: hypothetical protein VJA87_00060 [Candidatus Paceibacterota bacterium]
MPALQGIDEREAAELVIKFLHDLAQKLEHYNARFFGLHHPIQFRACHTGHSSSEKESSCLTGRFEIDVRGGKMHKELASQRSLISAPLFKKGEWLPFAAFTLHRVDWDDTPEMQSGVCLIFFPHRLPAFFKEDVDAFMKVNFGHSRIGYFNA